ERAQETVDVLRRLTQFAVVRIRLHVTTRFGIEQYRLHDEPEIAASVRTTLRIQAVAIVVEDSGDALDVRGARIARHQMLNELLADEWADVRVIGQVLHDGSHV